MLSIVITTFKYRFEKYFISLLNSIKDFDLDIEVIVTVNGEHKENFDVNYRREILHYISTKKNVFPVMFPQFRGLAKLWNTGIIHSSNEYILLLNDDVLITDKDFLEIVKVTINRLQTSFKINGSFSHVVLKKSEVIDLNFFDDRLLGIGEEEEFCWRYEKMYQKVFKNVSIPGIINYVDMTHSPTNIKTGASGKYSKFNRDLLFNHIYRIDEENGEQHAMIQEKLIYNGWEKQYPYEKFYLENKDKL